MNVSPLDLRQQRFHSRFRGFDKVEVTAFLSAVADDYEQALRETDRLRQEVARMEAVLDRTSRARAESAVDADDGAAAVGGPQGTAEKEADRIIREAEGRSQLMLDKTQARLEDVQREIDGMKLKRRDVETTIESTIQTLRNTLEYVREQENRERDEKSCSIARGTPRRPTLNEPRRRILLRPAFGALIRQTATGVDWTSASSPARRKPAIAGERDGALLVRVAAPPVDDAANNRLV